MGYKRYHSINISSDLIWRAVVFERKALKVPNAISNRMPRKKWSVSLVCSTASILSLATACSNAAPSGGTQQTVQASDHNEPVVRAKATASPQPENLVIKSKSESLESIFTENFTNAIMARGARIRTTNNSDGNTGFGMSCTPTDVSKTEQKFEISLPENPKDRAHAFVALTPNGRLYEIYSPYGGDVEAEDIVIPSQAINWALASKQRSFALTVDDMSGIEVGKDYASVIFVEDGAYAFALVSSFQKDLIETNGTQPPVTVFSGCVINFKS
jgi:hypothetical protein